MTQLSDLMNEWMMGGEPRMTAARADIAHSSLEGKIKATRFAEGEIRQLFAHSAPIRNTPRHDGTQISELLFGEGFLVLDENEGWAWGQSIQDGYVGYIPAHDLINPLNAPTHWVINPTHLYRRDDIKSAPITALPSGGLVLTEPHDKAAKFLKMPERGFIPTSHLLTVQDTGNYIDMAISFLDVPYLWGGRSHRGIDCSGLIQVALQAAGLNLPRDTDLQQISLSAQPDDGGYSEGDILFFPGHVGIMVDDGNLLHANAHHMMTVVEPLDDVIARLAESAESNEQPNTSPVTGVVRADHIQSLIDS